MEKIKAYVEDYALDNGGNTPSTRELGLVFGVSHVCIHSYLRSMDEIGMLSYENGTIRTDKIDKIERGMEFSPSFLGSIPAGTPDEVEASIEEYVSIPSIFTDNRKGKFYILKVTGDSMIDAGINSGDLVIVQEKLEAHSGDIVAALVNESGSTLKRLRLDEQGPYLWAENESWDIERRFYGRQFAIQGIAIKVVKNLA